MGRDIPGLFGASPFRPVVMFVSSIEKTIDSLYDWTPEELAAACGAVGVNFDEVWSLITNMHKDGSSLLYIDLDVYLNAKEKS